MKIRYDETLGRWVSTEIYSDNSFGYGRFIFYVASRVDGLDSNAVLGLFIYSDDRSGVMGGYKEIDIEFSRWGYPESQNVWYTVWSAYSFPSHESYGFSLSLSNRVSMHYFEWSEGSVEFASMQGRYGRTLNSWEKIEGWTYTGADIPGPPAHVHINLWLIDNPSGLNEPYGDGELEVIIERFEYLPNAQLSHPSIDLRDRIPLGGGLGELHGSL